MADRASFAYAHARLQAHHGRRPSKTTWRHLNASKSLGHYLESARQAGLAPWVSNLTPTADIHGIEAALRRDWRTYVKCVAAWLPSEWRAAVEWTGDLADLPLTTHQAREQEAKPDQYWAAQRVPLAGWRDRFMALWPRSKGSDARQMKELFGVLENHLSPVNRFYKSDPVEARYALIARLERLFRRHAQRPVAVFAFLAMVAMDVEHLRAHLVHRRLFVETLDNR